jgi:TetR/AcrR family transcriptional repressor of lmrAB and yxaGH operons
MASDTRQQMIEAAARLFQRDGYHATSWRRLVQEAGTPWGSIHHHFPGGKEELGVVAVDAGADAVAALIEFCFTESPDPASALGRWFELSGNMLADSAYTAGCPVATVALETCGISDPMRQATRRAFVRWQELIAAALRDAGAADARAQEAAMGVLVLLEGGLLLTRVHGNNRPLQAAARQAQAVVRTALE